jgi:hypothetical protein
MVWFMSLSDTTTPQDVLARLADECSRLEATLLIQDGRALDDLDIGLCARLLGSAVRMFVAAGNTAAQDDDGPLPRLDLTPTDAVVVAAALLRDQGLTPFDLTLWFQRVASHAKKSNSFNAAVAQATKEFAGRLAETRSTLA